MKTESKNRSADGVIERAADGRDLIRFERRLDHPIERVWAALTEPDGLIGWWGEAEVEIAIGGRFSLRWLNTDDEGNAVRLDARISELQPLRVLEVTGSWGAEGPEGGLVDANETTLRFELESDRDSTALRFLNTVSLSDDERTMVPAGWHYHLDALDTSLAGGNVDLADPWAAWEPIHDGYAERRARG